MISLLEILRLADRFLKNPPVVNWVLGLVVYDPRKSPWKKLLRARKSKPSTNQPFE